MDGSEGYRGKGELVGGKRERDQLHPDGAETKVATESNDNNSIEKFLVPKFLETMKEYQPTIPPEVVSYYLDKSGCNCSDPKLKRVIALATQKFIFNVVHDAKRFNDLRREKTTRKTAVLKMEDLASSLEEHGINIVKPEYFADNPT